jgi:phosphoglycolate phosphatase
MSWQAIRLVVFDLDGTLVDSIGDIATALNAALAQITPGVPALPVPRVRAFVGDGARLLVARGLEAAGLQVALDEALPVFVDAYRRHLLDTTTLYPGVRETLERLSTRRLAVLTNKPGEMSRAILSGLGVARRFFRIVGGDDAPRHKPDPQGLLELMRVCDCTAEETMIVGDSAVDVRTGRAAGVRSVGVTYGFAPHSFQAEPPDAQIGAALELLDLLDPAPPRGVAD